MLVSRIAFKAWGNLRVHVKLSFGSRKVPNGQLATHCPCDRTIPGKHPVHCTWSTVDATLKFGILHVVHFAGHASHWCLLLSAIKAVPWQIPFPSGATQLPFELRVTVPEAQMMQSPEPGPEQV